LWNFLSFLPVLRSSAALRLCTDFNSFEVIVSTLYGIEFFGNFSSNSFESEFFIQKKKNLNQKTLISSRFARIYIIFHIHQKISQAYLLHIHKKLYQFFFSSRYCQTFKKQTLFQANSFETRKKKRIYFFSQKIKYHISWKFMIFILQNIIKVICFM
jgi:hypothetical protein